MTFLYLPPTKERSFKIFKKQSSRQDVHFRAGKVLLQGNFIKKSKFLLVSNLYENRLSQLYRSVVCNNVVVCGAATRSK